jgi:hypothetical protein
MKSHEFAHLLLRFDDGELIAKDVEGNIIDIEPEMIEEHSAEREGDNILLRLD